LILRSLTIGKRNGSPKLIAETLARFAELSERYASLPKVTEEYKRLLGEEAVAIHATYKEPFPSLSFAAKGSSHMELTNIVPQTRSALSTEEYNQFLMQFAEDLLEASRKNKLGLSVSATGDELTLESAISGKKTRSYFERYLSQHPTSYHAYDVQRLDVFICVASRYPRCRLNLGRLQRYLIEKLKWKECDATWCTKRIETGLEVLKVNRRL